MFGQIMLSQTLFAQIMFNRVMSQIIKQMIGFLIQISEIGFQISIQRYGIMLYTHLLAVLKLCQILTTKVYLGPSKFNKLGLKLRLRQTRLSFFKYVTCIY